MRYEWNLTGDVGEFIDTIRGEVIDAEEGSLLDNYLVGTDGLCMTEEKLDVRDGSVGLFKDHYDFPSGIVMITERYLTPWTSGYHVVFSDEGSIYDEWDAFVEECRRDYDE